MPKAGKHKREAPKTLKGWKAIGDYLGIGAATAQRWAKGGMPVRREGRFTVADADEIRKWLGKEAHMPGSAYVVTDTGDDISAALRESISALRRQKKQ